MLKLQPIEFILRAMPESFLVILAIYIFSKTKINKKKYIVTSIVFSTILYISRMLPIDYGVHMILSVLALLAIVMLYNKIDAIKGIKSIVFIYLIQLVSELINVVILKLVNIDLEVLSMDGLYKTILGLPSLIITGVIVLMVYKIEKRKEAKQI